MIWLMKILNAIVELESVPEVLKRGVVVPVYKGRGKDSLRTDSYRGITLASMVVNVLEFLLLECLESVFLEAGLPHINQFAYRRAVSCEDAVFATQEVIAKYLRGGSRVYMRLYDQQKVFDSVEYPVLLEKLFNAGVNGKMWRLLKNWYEGGSCQVKLDGRHSDSFFVERGIKQGSVLSPTLILLVMDPFLRQLQTSGMSLSVNNFCAGGFLHADDIRTLATSEASMRYKIDLVKDFAEQNLLKLNVSKCEIVLFSKQPSTALPVCEVDGSVMPAGDVGKCLGKGDLSASRSVEENIREAHQGDISPLSSKEVIKSCVMPVLLYGSENWIMTDALMERLEIFQAELVKRVLKWPKHHPNTDAIAILDIPTMKCRILVKKLGFLRRVMEGDPDSLCGSFGTGLTREMLLTLYLNGRFYTINAFRHKGKILCQSSRSVPNRKILLNVVWHIFPRVHQGKVYT